MQCLPAKKKKKSIPGGQSAPSCSPSFLRARHKDPLPRPRLRPLFLAKEKGTQVEIQKAIHAEAHREMHTERCTQRDKQRDKQRDTETHTQTQTHRHTHTLSLSVGTYAEQAGHAQVVVCSWGFVLLRLRVNAFVCVRLPPFLFWTVYVRNFA